MAKRYDLSLLPSLQEQVAYYEKQNDELSAHVKAAYEDFLAYIDTKSVALADKPEYDSLQQVYGLATARMDALLTVLDEESDDIGFWHKELAKVEKDKDEAHFNDVAAELIEGGDYRANAQEFKTWISAQVAELKQELTELLDDWRGCVDDGEITELAYLLEALADEQEEGEERADPFSELDVVGDDDDNESSDEQEQEEACCPSGAGSADEQRSGGCCGRQTPCCQDTEK